MHIARIPPTLSTPYCKLPGAGRGLFCLSAPLEFSPGGTRNTAWYRYFRKLGGETVSTAHLLTDHLGWLAPLAPHYAQSHATPAVPQTAQAGGCTRTLRTRFFLDSFGPHALESTVPKGGYGASEVFIAPSRWKPHHGHRIPSSPIGRDGNCHLGSAEFHDDAKGTTHRMKLLLPAAAIKSWGLGTMHKALHSMVVHPIHISIVGLWGRNLSLPQSA